MSNLRSNAWNVELNYEMYDKEFKDKFEKTVESVNKLQNKYKQMFTFNENQQQ